MSISLVCVFNDPAVLEQCLRRSLEGSRREVVELVAVDNTGHRFPSAGAALNHGARLASHDVVGFVHQDVYLHSLPRLLEVAGMLREITGRWGMIGAAGISPDGEIIGRLRDRVQLIGRSVDEPVEVDSLDEVLFLVPRLLVLREPLTHDPDLAWHAYAVEYGIRLRAAGWRVGAVDLAITHNSLTVNLARLAEAHARVQELYPAAVPVRTTCGTVGAAPSRLRSTVGFSRHAWRHRGLRESLAARHARSLAGAGTTVLADIRLDVDAVTLAPGERFRVVNLDATAGFARVAGEPVELARRDTPFELTCVTHVAELQGHLSSEVPGPLLCTNLVADDLTVLAAAGLLHDDVVIGIHESDVWLLTGVARDRIPSTWLHGRAVPFNALRPLRTAPRHRSAAGTPVVGGTPAAGERGSGDGVLH